MQVPLTVRDHLDRAESVYGDRVGIVDEPDQPAPPFEELTYRDVARRARAFSAGLESLGVPQGGRVAVVSQNSARLLCALLDVHPTGEPISVGVTYAPPEGRHNRRALAGTTHAERLDRRRSGRDRIDRVRRRSAGGEQRCDRGRGRQRHGQRPTEPKRTNHTDSP